MGAGPRLYWRMAKAGRSKSRAARSELDKSPEELAALLTRAGGQKISAAAIRRDLKAGAPKNQDGTIHVLNYAAWLAREHAREGD